MDSSFSLVVLLPAHSAMSSLVRALAHSGLTASSNQGCDKMSVQVSGGHYVRRSQGVMLYNVFLQFSVFTICTNENLNKRHSSIFIWQQYSYSYQLQYCSLLLMTNNCMLFSHTFFPHKLHTTHCFWQPVYLR